MLVVVLLVLAASFLAAHLIASRPGAGAAMLILAFIAGVLAGVAAFVVHGFVVAQMGATPQDVVKTIGNGIVMTLVGSLGGVFYGRSKRRKRDAVGS